MFHSETQMLWLFFDIEIPKKDFTTTIIDIKGLIEEIKLVINRPVMNYLGEQVKYWFIQDSSGKQKYRIFTNLMMTLPQMKYISDQINNKLIDDGVYSVGKSIWLPNSYKFDTSSRKFEERYYKIDESKYLNCVVNYTENCIKFTDSILLSID